MDGNSINKASAVSTIYQQQAVAQQSVKSSQPEAEKRANAEKASNDSVKISSRVTLRNLDTVRAIEQLHAHLNQQAKGVRETNEAVNKVVEQVGAMRSNLQAILKNFPPYPIDSKERSEILMEYTSLRKQLMSLMVPPPPPPVYEKIQGMWSSLFEENGQVAKSNIPELENRSGDTAIKEAAYILEKTSTTLAEFSDKVTQALVTP